MHFLVEFPGIPLYNIDDLSPSGVYVYGDGDEEEENKGDSGDYHGDGFTLLDYETFNFIGRQLIDSEISAHRHDQIQKKFKHN